MNLERGRVLILDDEEAVGKSIARLAEHLLLESRSETNAEAFLKAVDQWKPTHIILDLVMPGMDGVQVLQRLADMNCTARIAISSGIGGRVLNAAYRSAAEHGLDIACVLPKPFTASELKEFLHNSHVVASGRADRRRMDSKAQVTTLEDLLSAIREQQLSLVYQPKIDCRTKDLMGFEALVRWQHPTRGNVMPDQFIPLAERHGLIGAITDQVVEMGLRWFSGLPNSTDLSLSVNISAKTMGDMGFVDKLLSSCHEARVSANNLILEITETAAMDDQLLALDLFTRLRMKGFHVSIDDFGIGNSSLALLARLPFSEIKVDKSFAMSATRSEESRAIIKSTVDLSHSLDLTVVTEGVEDSATLEFLNDIGCDLAQGYFIARPMPGDAVEGWVLQRQDSARWDPS
ncbi:MAG: EAL domain-containing response regulator [Fimbriimonas sp.]|nr:EAL domain-containing response regulator [Fimbriimonas sp.]